MIVALVVALLVATLPPVRANAAPPTPVVPLPPEIDLIDGYEGQSLCDPSPKQGTLMLRDTLWRTYGSAIWAGISRDCNVSWDPGISEHKDGRAIDWGVTVRDPGSKAIGDEFFAWATANNGEMARRMGIMYIIWDSRMWRLYDMDRGFPEYRNCVSQLTSASYDTTCHRDHMHISMTWHGAGSATSWYDGSAVTQPACSAGQPVGAQPGSPAAPSVMFDPLAGVGVAGGACYLGKSIQALRVPAQSPMAQRIRISHTSANAPSPVRIWTNAGSRITVGPGSTSDQTMTVAGDGLIYVQQPVGQSVVRVEGLGQTSLDNIDPGWQQVPGSALDIAFAQISGGWEMFHIGLSGTIFRKKWQNGSTTGWTPIPGLQAKRIAVATSADGRVELFHIGMNDAVFHNWETTPGGEFSPASALGGYAKEIAAARSGDQWEVYHVGGSGQIWRATQTARPWQALPGTWAASLAATTNRAGRVELFHIGGNGQTYHAWQNTPGGAFYGSAGINSWNPHGGNGTTIAAANGINGSYEVYTTAPDGSLNRLAPASIPYGWQRIAGTGTRIAATNSPDGRAEVVLMNGSGNMYHAWQKRVGWF